MSESTTTTWTCDRCKATEVTESSSSPRHWYRLVLVVGPRANPIEGDVAADKHLCKGCESDFAEWLFPSEGGSLRCFELQGRIAELEAELVHLGHNPDRLEVNRG